MNSNKQIKAIIGLGNPGPKFAFTPHNIGFLIVERICEQFHGLWTEKPNMMQSVVNIHGLDILLIKPTTFMNDSGKILPILKKQGIALENILVVHDEIDFDFGKITIKDGGSARGHNGLRSLIAHGGDNFLRLRCGVSRPEDASEVSNFVIASFKQTKDQVDTLIQQAVIKIFEILNLQN